MAGADPSYKDVHLLRTLLKLHETTLGRKNLVKYLGIGEGSVRTIIKKLSSAGLIDSSKTGHMLTHEGEKYVDNIMSRISAPAHVELGDFLPGDTCAVKVTGIGLDRGDWVDLRDIALKNGADGAVILVNDGKLRFPSKDMDIDDYPLVRKALSDMEGPDKGAIVIGFSANLAKAEDGALSIVQKLLE